MKCSEIRDQLGFYLDGMLSEQTLEEVEDHLAGCAECRQEARHLKAMLQAMDADENEPPESLRNAIKKAARGAEVCSQVFPLLSRFIDADLTPKENTLVTVHISECEACAEELDELRAIAQAPGLVEPVEPPANLRVRITLALTPFPAKIRCAYGWAICFLPVSRVGLEPLPRRRPSYWV